MPRVNYILKYKSNPASIYVRFTNGRKLDITTKSELFINPTFWDDKRQEVRNTTKATNRNFINNKLKALEAHLFETYMVDYTSGEYIDNQWLKKTIKTFYGQPIDDTKQNIYWVDFADNWIIKQKEERANLKTGELVNSKTILNYESAISFVKKYEKKHNKLKFIDIDLTFHARFIKFMGDLDYGGNTIGKIVSRFKTICREAKESGIKVNPVFESRKFYIPKEETFDVYLDEKKIDILYNLKIENDSLDNVRDNLIIGCWTGQRVSDFLVGLSTDKIHENIIDITAQKTGERVAIPIHPMVANIIKKRNGKLPKKINESDFNKKIKQICKDAGFKEMCKGKVMNADTKRKKLGDYPFHELITSHTCRRSFATNLDGKISSTVIMKIGGWKNEITMRNYIKKASKDSAIELQEYYYKKWGYLSDDK